MAKPIKTRIRVLLTSCISFLALYLPACYAHPAVPRCQLPIPDGGNVTPNKPNVSGRISKVGQNYIEIRNQKSSLKTRVGFNSTTQFYGVFGGDYTPDEFRIGQQAYVWFIGCKKPINGRPEAAYLQLFSSDPQDQPLDSR